MSIRNLATLSLKLTLSGAVIAAIAGLFLVISDDGQVPEAQADVTNLIPRTLAQHQNFDRVIKRAGLEPRPYDHNGNNVFFAAGESEMAPQELLTYFQDEFKRHGINSEIYTEPLLTFPDTMEEAQANLLDPENGPRNHALLNGEIVPFHVSPEMVSMGGILPHVKTEGPEDLLHDWIPNDDGIPDIRTNARGYRFIEARLDPDSGRSVVTAAYSDSYYDFNKALDPEAPGVTVDPEVPGCIGCQRLNRLQGLSGHDPFTLNHYISPNSAANTQQNYQAAMRNRGWRPTQGDQILEALRDHVPELRDHAQYMINFERDGEFVSFVINDESMGSSIVTIQGPQR